jgi:hypothetical protein
MAERRIEKDDRDLKEGTTAKKAMRTGPAAGERTTRQGAAIDTGTTAHHVAEDRPVTGTVLPQGVTTTPPLKPFGTVDEAARRHARDESVHPDWERQPQINAPQDVGVPTPEGQADAARIRAGRRRSDEAEEPRLERRGDEVTVPAASRENLEAMKRKARDEDVDRRT